MSEPLYNASQDKSVSSSYSDHNFQIFRVSQAKTWFLLGQNQLFRSLQNMFRRWKLFCFRGLSLDNRGTCMIYAPNRTPINFSFKKTLMERFLQEKKKKKVKLSREVYQFAAVTSEREKVEEFAVRVLAMLSKIRKRFCSSSSCHNFSSSCYYSSPSMLVCFWFWETYECMRKIYIGWVWLEGKASVRQLGFFLSLTILVFFLI